jgi:replicative DNA helicase
VSRIVDGATFLHSAEHEVPAVWGDGSTVAWASGEALMVVGPQGVGKSTVLQQIAMSRLGLSGPLFGMDLRHDQRRERVLYIAADRPKQIARSWRRMVSDEHLDDLRDRLVVWRGPLEFDLGRSPEKVAPFIAQYAVQTVIIDSLKDVAVDLTKDETGSRVNLAFQNVLALDVELAIGHHQRKGQQGGGRPKALEDVYGSTWLTAGCGSVILLWGKAGDPVVELDHLKQPSDPVGPMKLIHDHQAGRTRIYQQADLAEIIRESKNGLTIRDAAKVLFGSDDPDPSETEKARRQLTKLVDRKVARRVSPGKPSPDLWVSHAGQSRSNHANHAEGSITRPPLRGGARVTNHGTSTPVTDDER